MHVARKVAPEKVSVSVFKNYSVSNSPCRSAPVSFTPSLDIGTDVPVKSSCWIEKSGVVGEGVQTQWPSSIPRCCCVTERGNG